MALRSHVIESDSEEMPDKHSNATIDCSKTDLLKNDNENFAKEKINHQLANEKINHQLTNEKIKHQPVKKKQKIQTDQSQKLNNNNKPKVIEDIDGYAFELINEMKNLYKEDEKLMEQNKPGKNKIENVEKIVCKIMKKDIDEACVRLGVLIEIKKWLEPLKDRSLPNPKIQKTLLNLLHGLPLSKDDLLNSGVGKIVNFYYRNKHESKDIRKEARKIIKKWKEKIIKEELEEYE